MCFVSVCVLGEWDEWVRVDGGRLRAPQDWSSGSSDDEVGHHSSSHSDWEEVGPQGLFGACNGRYWRVNGAAQSDLEDQDGGSRRLLPVKATLIVCPTHIREQWHEEILRHTHANALTVVCYDGCKAAMAMGGAAHGRDLARVSLEQLGSADIGISSPRLRLSCPVRPAPVLLSRCLQWRMRLCSASLRTPATKMSLVCPKRRSCPRRME